VRNAIYFGFDIDDAILGYDLGRQELSMISLPPMCYSGNLVLMAAEDGGPGFAIVQESKLCLWSRVWLSG
jgi:hypothetical protein